MREINFRQAIGEALDEEMQRDPAVFIIGEDVGKMGGLMGEIGGLIDKYGPEKVRDTPLSEAAILGAAIGAAITGMRPVARMRFVDFLGIAALCPDYPVEAHQPEKTLVAWADRCDSVLTTDGNQMCHKAAKHLCD